jgi:hypothetical protein
MTLRAISMDLEIPSAKNFSHAETQDAERH